MPRREFVTDDTFVEYVERSLAIDSAAREIDAAEYGQRIEETLASATVID